MSVHSSDKTTVKAPKRYKEPEYKPFDVVKWLRSDSEYKTQPKHEIGPLEQGHNIKEYGPFIRNMDENVQELLDYSSPLDDIYEAQGGTDPYINTGLDLLGPAELAKIGLAGAKGAAIVVPLLKAPKGEVVRLFHGSTKPVEKFVDPLTVKSSYHTMRGPGLYTTPTPSLGRSYTDPKTGVSELYTLDIPEEEFAASIYRPTLAKNESRLRNVGISKSTPERKELQDFLANFLKNRVDTEDYTSIYPYTAFGPEKDIAKDLAYAQFLRDAGYIGHGPYKDVSGNKAVYNLLNTPEPTYKILLEPSDYNMSPSEFDEYITTLLPPSVNPDRYK